MFFLYLPSLYQCIGERARFVTAHDKLRTLLFAVLRESEFLVWPFECIVTLLTCLPIGVDLQGSEGREVTYGLVSSLIAQVCQPLPLGPRLPVHVMVSV